MTTIAWDGNELAADTMITGGDYVIGHHTKVVKRKDGALCGVAGCSSLGEDFKKWFLAGGTKTPHPCVNATDDFAAIVVLPDKTLMWYDTCGSFEYHALKTAIGSGSKFAIGAMEFGATAGQAVGIAAMHDLGTGGNVSIFTVGKDK